MTDLSTRIENVRPEMEGALIEEAWEAIAPTWQIDPALLGEKAGDFAMKMDARAYLDAALLLLPEGWEWTVESGGHVEILANRLRGPFVEGNAATPALAIAAAAVRAHPALADPASGVR